VKQQWREVEHSPPPNAEVKNDWSYTSAPPVYLHGVDRETFTYTPSSILVAAPSTFIVIKYGGVILAFRVVFIA
jgi:hypothetical protein